MADQVTRSAARLAALIAVPVALLAGIGVFALFNGAFQAADPAGSDPPPATAPMPTAPVEMPARALTERQEVVCRALLSQLPATLDELAPRAVTEGPEQNAAYGQPPITVACGVDPADYSPIDTVYPHEGVCWHAVERTEATVWTTLDREVPVRVTVPAAYDGPFQRVLALNRAVAETVRAAPETAPDGCRP